MANAELGALRCLIALFVLGVVFSSVSAEDYFAKGNALFDASDFDGALVNFRKHLAEHPGDG